MEINLTSNVQSTTLFPITWNFYFKVKCWSRNISKVNIWLYRKQLHIWYTLLLTMNGRSYMGLRMAYSHVILAHARGHGQGNVYFHNEYLWNGDRCGEDYYCHEIVMHGWTFVWHIFILIWPILKVKVIFMSISTTHIFEMVIDWVEFTTAFT